MQGKLDIMIEAETKLWAIAAKVIIEEAGGRFTQLDGKEVDQATITAVVTNGKLHQAVVSSFR